MRGTALHRLLHTRCPACSCTMWPALDPVSHRVPRTKPTCLSTPRRPPRHRPFALVLHLHQRKSNRNLHLQYLSQGKRQSTQRCQPLIPSASTTHHINNARKKTQHNTHKASNHPVNRSSYINQGTSQLGFTISPLMSALPKDDLKAKGKTHSSAQKPRKSKHKTT